MPMSEIERCLLRRVCLYFVVFYLLLIVLNHLFELLRVFDQLGLHFLQPLLLAVVFEFENRVRDDPVDYRRVNFVDFDVSIQLNVNHQCSHVEILVEVQLILHFLDLSKHLVRQQPQPGEVFPTFSGLDFKRQKVILLENQSRMGLR